MGWLHRRLAGLDVRSKLRTINLVTTGAAFLLVAAAFIVHLGLSERDDLVRNAEVMARVMAQNTQSTLLFDDAATAATLIAALSRNRDVLGAELVRPDGSTFARYRRPDLGAASAALPDFPGPPGEQVTWHFHLRQFDLEAPVESDGGRIGAIRLRVGLDATWTRLASSIAILVFASLAAIGIATLLLRRLQDTIVVPLSRLHETMARVAAGDDYTQRAESFGDDEIGALSQGFNRMIEQIQARDVALGRELAERRRAEDLLRHSEARYRHLFADSQVVMLTVDPESARIVDANAAASAFYGYPLDQLRGRPIADINVSGPASVAAALSEALVGHGGRFDFRHRLAGGEVREVRVASGPVEIDGRMLLHSVVEDVTEQRRAERSMREALVVFEASSQGIMTTDADGIITAVNPAFATITGYAAAEVIGQRPSLFKSGRQDAGFYADMWAALRSSGHWQGEIWNRRRSGEIYPQWLTITPVRDATGSVVEFVAMFSDITERKRQEHEIWQRANFDALTGLANRSLLHERLGRGIVRAQRNRQKLGLIFIDLDGFKWINDTLGHDVGDLLLVEVAQRLRGCVREQDTVARLGGDEFTVVIHDLDNPEALVPIAEKLVDTLRRPFAVGGSPQHVSGSLGVTVYPDDGSDVQTLLKHADIAMYNAKQAGKNRFRFYAEQMQQDAQLRLQTESELRLALERGEFELHYQPIVAVADADAPPVGAEALIRWRHPVRGLVGPVDFIPVAEECGLIAAIGEWVIREAARQSRSWLDAGLPPLRLAVNVSPLQFRDPGLAALVETALAENEIERRHFLLEITESVLLDGNAAVESRMGAIRALGVAYALDDFGTGYSSLSYLKRFPVDVLKIDRSFVRDSTEDAGDAHLIEAIISMAHGLGMKVTAEGVETEAQLALLRRLGCDYAQGYLIGRPQPGAARMTATRAAPAPA